MSPNDLIVEVFNDLLFGLEPDDFSEAEFNVLIDRRYGYTKSLDVEDLPEGYAHTILNYTDLYELTLSVIARLKEEYKYVAKYIVEDFNVGRLISADLMYDKLELKILGDLKCHTTLNFKNLTTMILTMV